MNQATFSFNKWNTILGWVTTILLTYTYRRTYNELWDCGEYVRLLQNCRWAPPGAPCLALSSPCLQQSTHCFDGKYDLRLFKCIYHLFFSVFINNS
jgi:hypothetical protein